MSKKEKVLKKLKKEIRAGVYSYLVLKFLEKGELHGYAIRKSFEKLTSGKFVPSEGALYDILKSLQRQGLIESFWVVDTRPRKCYRLTELGKEVLKELNSEVNLVSEAIEKVKGGEESWTS